MLRRLPHFVLIGVAASREVRFQRLLSRSRPGDPQTLEEFTRREQQENTEDPNAQRLEATFGLADRIIENEGILVDLHREIDRVLEELAERAAAETSGRDVVDRCEGGQLD